LNEKEKYGKNPLLETIFNDNIKMVKLLIDYANKNKIILKLNEKNIIEWYPLLRATHHNNNIEMVKVLIDYSNKNKIILELNEKDEYGCTPISESIQNNNVEMFKLLVEYSIEKGIKLRIDENNVEKEISEKFSFCKLKNISEINSKFIELIYFCKNKNIIKVIFSKNSYFLKRFNEIDNNKKIEYESNDYEILEIENELMKIKLEKKRKIKEEKENQKLEIKNYIMEKIKIKEIIMRPY